MNYEQLSAFLGGTVGTIIIKVILDYFSKNQDHKQVLQKITYERKLQVGEAAIAFHSYYLYNTINLRSGLQALIDAVDDFNDTENGKGTDLDNIEKSMQRVGSIIVEMFGPKYHDILSMNLYFDFLDSNDTSGDNITAVFTAVGQATATSQEVEFWIAQSTEEDQKGNSEAAEFHYQKAINLFPLYLSQLKEVVKMLEQDVVNSGKVISSIKNQLRIY